LAHFNRSSRFLKRATVFFSFYKKNDDDDALHNGASRIRSHARSKRPSNFNWRRNHEDHSIGFVGNLYGYLDRQPSLDRYFPSAGRLRVLDAAVRGREGVRREGQGWQLPALTLCQGLQDRLLEMENAALEDATYTSANEGRKSNLV
jgi:hypothetical protein